MFIHVTITQKNVKSFPIHAHDTWEYICYEEGAGFLKTEDGDIPFKEGTVVLVPPGQKHGSSSDRPFKNVCIHTDFSITDNRELLYLPSASSEVRGLFGVVGGLYREKEKYSDVIETLIFALKPLVLREAEVAVEASSLTFVRNEIAKNFTDSDFDLSKIVKRSGYVDDVLRIKFKRVYGITPKGYLDDLRMGIAKDYLRIYGNILSVKEISEMCGFRDPLYFSRKFKNEFGIAPKEYAKRKIEKE